mmetsp:Transcript_52084/g.121103  ORF Transcript_52084/g.121103 Transcript_52084/m.121103 type:complete len:377 (+) Transcript_52084:88-1218(+)
MDTLAKILSEMLLFLGLLVANEACRWVLKRRAPNARLLQHSFWVCSLVLGWFTVSITLILYNKWVITSWGPAGIRCPIFYTSNHMLLKGMFAGCYFQLFQRRSPPKVSWQAFLGLSFAGAFASLDILTSNMSYIYISASFYTFLKSSSLVFVLFFALVCCLEPCSVSTISTVVLVSTGMFLSSYGEPEFNTIGLILVVTSEVFAALRWIVTQIMLQDDSIDAMTAVLYMSPAAVLTCVPCVVARERHDLAAFFQDAQNSASLVALFLFPGFLAFLLLLLEVQLVKETSSLTLTVFGNLKSVSTILFSVVVFHEQTSVLQWCGLLIALTGMLAYSHSRGEWVASETFDGFKWAFGGKIKGDSPVHEKTPLSPPQRAV